MKLVDLCCALWAGRVYISIDGEKGSHEFRTSEWNDTGTAIRKACQEFGERFVDCIFPMSQNEIMIVLKKAG